MGRSPGRKAPHRMVNSPGAPVGSLEAECGVNMYTNSAFEAKVESRSCKIAKLFPACSIDCTIWIASGIFPE